MSIEQLKKILESERLDTSKQYGLDMFPVQNIQTTEEFTQDVNFARRMTHSEAYKSGHEAATNRLLQLLEKAVKMANFYADKENWDDEEFIPTIWDNDKIDLGDKAREFLSEFTKMTEIKKESGK